MTQIWKHPVYIPVYWYKYKYYFSLIHSLYLQRILWRRNSQLYIAYLRMISVGSMFLLYLNADICILVWSIRPVLFCCIYIYDLELSVNECIQWKSWYCYCENLKRHLRCITMPEDVLFDVVIMYIFQNEIKKFNTP